MIDHLDQIAGLLAGLSLCMALAGYVIYRQQHLLHLRLATFVGGNMVPMPAPAFRPSRRVRVPRLTLGATSSYLIQAGSTLSPRAFLFVQLAAGLSGLAVARLATLRLGFSSLSAVLALAAGLILGLALPRLILHVKRSRRLRLFELQFANALESLANALEVGLSLTQSFEILARDMPAPLSPEFAQVVRELGLGLPVSEALTHLADRVPGSDVEIFTAAVQIQHRTGGSLAPILRTLAATVRQRVNLRGEISAMTAQQRYSAYIVCALPFALAVALKFLSPSYFNHLLDPGLIRFLLVGACAGIVVGFYFMMRISDIEV